MPSQPNTPSQEDPPVVHHSADITVKIDKVALPDPNCGSGMDNAQRELVTVDKPHQEGPVAQVPESAGSEKYREWYDTPVAGSSSSESGSGPSGSAAPLLPAPALPYPVPGYYPMPWVHAYAQPYSMSYYSPYPAYPMPALPMQPPGSDTNSSAVGHPWHGMMYNVGFHRTCSPNID